jgi:hypothetical protein
MSAVMEWIPYLSGRYQGHMGSYCYVLSWLVLKTDATRNPQRGNIYPYRAAPEHVEAQIPFLGSQVRCATDRITSGHAQL